MTQPKGKSKWPLYISILILIGIVLSYFFIPSVGEFFNEAWEVLTSEDEQRISKWVGQFGFWGPFLIVVAMVMQMFFFVIPSILLMVVTILAYGPWLGIGIILIAVFCASTVGYALGYFLGNPIVERVIGNDTKTKVIHFIDRYGVGAVAITRISPILSNDAISFVAGVLCMNYFKFIAATMAGIFPLAALIAYLGKEIDQLMSGLAWVSGISLVGYFAYIWWDKRRK